MTWDVRKEDTCVVAVMRTNSVNKLNKEFFADLHAFVDQVLRDHSDSPIVLASGAPKAFSAGLDFEYVFPIFASGDPARLREFVREYREIYYRLFSLPNPVIAAVDGPAIAGGFILLCCADYRIATRERTLFATNEVPIGIPMPAAYSELIRYAVGEPAAEELILRGHFVDAAGALALGVVHEVIEADSALERATEYAKSIHPDSISAYRTTKRILREPVVERCRQLGDRFDESTLIEGLMSEQSIRRREQVRRQLAERKGA